MACCFRGILKRAFVAILALAPVLHTSAKIVESDELDAYPSMPDAVDLINFDQPFSVVPTNISRSASEVHELFRQRGSPQPVLQYAGSEDDGDALRPYILGLAKKLAGEDFELPTITSPTPPQQFYIALIRSLQARDSGQVESAVRYAQQALDREPQHPFALNLLAQLQLMQGRYEEAEKLLDRALNQAPRFAGAISNRAALAYAREDYIEAVTLFDRALASQPDLCAAVLGRGAAQLRLGNLPESTRYLERCADVPRFEFNANLLRVGIALARRDYGKAEELAHWFQNTAPDSAHYWLAEIALHRGDPRAARQHLDSVEVRSPRVKYLSALGDAAAGDYTAAISRVQELQREIKTNADVEFAAAVLQFANEPGAAAIADEVSDKENSGRFALLGACKALARDNAAKAAELWRKSSGAIAGFDITGMSAAGLQYPLTDDGARNLALAILFYDTGYKTIARRELNEVLESSPEMPVALLLKAIIATELNDTELAASTLQQLMDLEPNSFSALYQSAELALRDGNYKRARTLLARAATEKPDKGALLKLALLDDSTDNFQGAVRAMETYIDSYPADFVGYNQLAWLYAKREQNLERALELALTADSLQQENVSVLDTIGWIHFLQGDLDKAVRHLEKANELASGKHPDVLFHLAALAAQREEKAKASRLIEQALELSMPFASREDAIKLLATLEAE